VPHWADPREFEWQADELPQGCLPGDAEAMALFDEFSPVETLA